MENYENESNELKFCNFSKSILMLLVVLTHSIINWSSGGWFQEPKQSSWVLGTMADWLGTFHIYSFVLISGYIFSYLTYEINRYTDFKKFAIKKLKRLLVPFAFVSLVWAAPWHGYFFSDNTQKLVSKFLFGESPAQLWFLLMLFWVFIFAYVFRNLIYVDFWKGLFIACILYFLGTLFGKVVPNFYNIFTGMKYFLFFFIGVQIRKYKTNYLRKIPLYIWISVDLILFIIKVAVSENEKLSLFTRVFLLGESLLLNIIGAISAFLILTRMGSYFSNGNNQLFKFLEKYNFVIYLFHQQIIYVVIDNLNGKLPPIIIATISFVLALLLSSLIAILFDKSKFTRFLVGLK